MCVREREKEGPVVPGHSTDAWGSASIPGYFVREEEKWKDEWKANVFHGGEDAVSGQGSSYARHPSAESRSKTIKRVRQNLVHHGILILVCLILAHQLHISLSFHPITL